MKRKILGMLPALMAVGFLLGGDATINQVVTFTNDNKTSVVINYSGTDELRFFAVDAAEGVFTLDLPGTFSKFDFSTLAFPQVNKVMQVPLDPDSASGISVRFFLARQVTYKVFEADAGELVLFFETQPDAIDVADNQPVDTVPADLSSESIATGEATAVLEGRDGEQRLHRLAVVQNDNGGRMYLSVDGTSRHKTFFLSNPKRFVLDLHDTVLGLDSGDLILDGPLVAGVRVRQFQSHPTPICRMVLDLQGETNVNVQPTADGFVVVYAGTANQLDQMMVQSDTQKDQASEDGIVIAATEKNTVENGVDAALTAFESEQPEDTLHQVSQDDETFTNNDSVAVTDALIDDTVTADVTEDQSEVTITTEPSVDEQADVAATETSAVDSQDKIAFTEPAATNRDNHSAAVDSTDDNTYNSSNDEVSADSTASSSLETGQAESTSTSQTDPLVATESAPIQNKEGGNLDDDDTSYQFSEPTDSYADDSATIENAVNSEPQYTQVRPLPKSKVSAASDVDAEMDNFLDEDGNQTFYDMMRDVPSGRKNTDPVVVTNRAIQDSKNELTESRLMQDEATEAEDFAELFREDTATVERIDGEETEYRGFEIAIIDVKDANVVDLLRFIADQVGINLYVDSSVGDIKATYRFRNIPWDQALDIILTNANLDKEFRNGVLRVATTEKFRQEEQARAQLRLQRELSVPTETVTISLNYADAAEVVPIVQEYLTPRGKVLMDERTNTLIIEEIPKRMTSIRTLVRRLDTIIPQVTIEARMVETNKRFLRELGIQWGLGGEFSPELGTDTGLSFPNRVGVGGPVVGLPEGVGTGPRGGYAVNFPVTGDNASGIGLTLGNFLDNFKLDISLQMLETEGYGQIISSPKVTTQNNKTALIKNGQQVPIQTIQRGVVTIRYIDAVLELQVTPHITSDETIIMDIVVDKSEPDFTRTVGGNPVINIRRAETKVLVKNGGTAVIGGIFTLNETTNESGIPTLRKVPILKRLFGSELESMENQELLIFVTPQIVKY